jgi:hypothetical protein
MRTNEQVRALLERLPEDVTLEGVQHHLYVAQTAARGEAAALQWFHRILAPFGDLSVGFRHDGPFDYVKPSSGGLAS